MVRLIFRRDGLTGKGTFGLVQKVKILKVTDVKDGNPLDSKKMIH